MHLSLQELHELEGGREGKSTVEVARRERRSCHVLGTLSIRYAADEHPQTNRSLVSLNPCIPPLPVSHHVS